MQPNEHSKRAQAYLEELCERLDRGCALTRGNWQSLRVPAFVPVALGLSLAACGGSTLPPVGDKQEICDNGEDDNGDGYIDCDDPLCDAFPDCANGALYGVPLEDCSNGVDDNGDGKIDCEDPKCSTFPGCMGVLYGVPREDCSNGVDDNGDGKVDCQDPQCASFSGCLNPPYSAPTEICNNGIDDDGDGLIDCRDPDCYGDWTNCPMTLYAAP